MPESTQHKLDRVRRPRVQITYDVETLGSIVKTELPFVVGIMADLSGNSIEGKDSTRPEPLPMKDRKYVEIDRDNFDSIMEKIGPSVKLSAKSGFSDTLRFSKLEDFNPINVLRKVPDLKKKFESRTRLSNLVAKLDGNVKLQEDFVKAFNDLMAQGDSTTLNDYLLAMNPPKGMPYVTDAETVSGVQTASGLVITPAADADGKSTTHFKITAITGGKVFKSDGKTEIVDNFITAAEGAEGLRFTPTDATVTTGNFTVQASKSDADTGLITDASAIATITVKPKQNDPGTTTTPTAAPGAPTVTDAETTRANQTTSGLVITPSADPVGKDATHFKITGIEGGKVFKTNGTTPVATTAANAFITAAEGATGLKFTPDPAGNTDGKFTVQASTSNADTGLIANATATAKITVK
ncbi:MAG: type secretion system protein ImpB [Pyrinomonadaceae bacterium]|jgi:type VI secretion system protein ImpB|nr:type secretion system protein ImpB [Pyrinomonadaceae bacterium]